jgi:GntR family transcriptional regulator/MocR family aminotransferase
MVLCDFIGQGHFARHLARMRNVYAERKQALATALRSLFGDRVGVDENCGMHLLLRLPPGADDVSLAAAARSHGLAVNALSSMSLRAATGPGFLLGYTNIPADAAMEAASRLHVAVQSVFPPPPHGAATDCRALA